MPLHDDEMNMRREKREAQRRKQQAEAKRLRITLILAAVVLVLCTAGIVFLTSRSDSSQTTVAAETRPTQKPTQATEPATRAQKSTKTTIHIKAAGDLNVTNTVINAGVAVGGYNYTRAFMDVASTLSDADLTVLNLEGNICGEPYGSDTTSAPRELLEGLRNAGVDLIQMANSCTINNGLIGLTSTLQTIRAAGLEPVGAFASESEFQQSKGYTITEAQGVKVAFVAFTKGLGGRGLPAGNDNLVNILYEDYASTYDKIDRTRITSVLKAVEAEKPDITIALLHWGSEYNDDISDTQKSIVNLMKKQGVDVIIGTHPHTVQAIEYDELAGTLVAYSLGDFFGDASRGGTNYSIILDLEITKDSSTGTTKVTNYSYTPIYTVSEAESADGYRRVVRIDKTVEAWEENYLDKVSQSAKESMVYALDRIEARINPPVEEKKK
ncbi:MAG: CapA family protein [Oscillospiraceae bacterium]|nr:CapA family protein [Oscillospiraceae bacterium]